MTHLLDDRADHPVEGEHDVRLGTEHQPQRLLVSRRVRLVLEQPFRHGQKMGVVVLRRVLARLNTIVLRVGFGETQLDSHGVDWALLLPGQLIRVVLALLQSSI